MENPEQKYLDIVTNNPAAFDSWTYLLQLIEQKNDIDQIRKIYDLFLAEYPYCYVYWEKYASFENNFGNLDKALAIYEKAIQEVRYSVDIWIYYVSFLIQQNIQEDVIRRVFEEGCEVVGLDYSSGGFWEKYIEYETSKGNNGKVNELLARVIRIPVQGLTSFYDKFFNRVFERPLTEFLENGKIMEGLNLELNKPPEQLKQEFLNKLQELFKTSQKTMEEMKKYEDLISSRYYYHFKEQSQDHLLNWHAYLDYVLSLQDHPRIVSTFERCLIACANYEEYFVRYSDYLEKVNKIEGAQKVLKRAVNVFFKNKPSILLHYASFCEQYQLDDVSLLYKNLFKHDRNNLHLDSILHHINYQKRKGNLQLVKHIYSSSLQLFKTYGNSSNTTTTTTEGDSTNPTTTTSSNNGKKEGSGNNFGEEINFLVIHYSNFLIKNCNSPNDSKKLFEEYLPFSSSLSLFLTFLSLLSCFSENEEDYNRILKEVYESDIFRNNSLSDTDKMKFHFNFLNYVRDYSNDIAFFRSVEKDFREFYPNFRSNPIINTKKRFNDDGNLQQKKLKFEPK